MRTKNVRRPSFRAHGSSIFSGRPTARDLARYGTQTSDTFGYNTHSESPRRLGGGLDKHEVFAPKGRAGNGVPASQPTQPTATRPLAIQKNGTWYTYGWDLTKNICETYRTDGRIDLAYTYTPYGEVSPAHAYDQPLRWSSEYHDTELGLVYYNYRHYNPAMGRWMGRDFIPEKQSPAVYAYANNTIKSDRLGLFAPGFYGAENAANTGKNYGVGNLTRGFPSIRSFDNNNSQCKVSVCCKTTALVMPYSHCVIRFIYSSGSVRGCRGGPSRDGNSGGSSGSSGSSNLSNGSSNSSGSLGTNNNCQSSTCEGCCGYWGNVVAGCGEKTEYPMTALQSGINSDLKEASATPSSCVFIKGMSDEEGRRKEECINSYMQRISSKCYIYRPMSNNSNTSWMTAFKHCFSEMPLPNIPMFQPGNRSFNERERCNRK